jgi:CheY-like chemotaxis protein
MNVAIVARNRVLRMGLMEQLRAAGANVVPRGGKNARRPGILLVDAGSGAQLKPAGVPDPAIPTIVLVTSGARANVQDLMARGFAGYLVKPVRQLSLIEQLRPDAGSRLSPGLQQAQSAPTHDVPVPGTGEIRVPRGLRILLVEDNAINALLTRELLRRRGHHVTEVTSGDGAVTAMETGTFDIVLMDIHMPGMDGIEATQAIRANETQSGRRRTPIIALTADALETGMRACKDAGMDGFLTKPIDPAQLDEMLDILFSSATHMQIAAA